MHFSWEEFFQVLGDLGKPSIDTLQKELNQK